MAVHGRPVLPHENPNNHDPLACSAARAAASIDLLRVRVGVLLGVSGDLGVIDALGVSSTSLQYSPMTLPPATKRSPTH